MSESGVMFHIVVFGCGAPPLFLLVSSGKVHWEYSLQPLLNRKVGQVMFHRNKGGRWLKLICVFKSSWDVLIKTCKWSFFMGGSSM